MLKNIYIENIAVIERADISFSAGLNVMSGETGAGKSIIIDSINAVLGNRTSKDIVRTGSEYALVSAVFDSKNVESWLLNNDINAESEVILQRKITSDGKSSCKVSGVPVTASQIRELASLLVDVHGQNDGLRLLDEKSHISFLDNYGSDRQLELEYENAYSKYCTIKNEIKKYSLDESEKIHLSDSLKYTINEINAADLHVGEYDSLISKRDLLRNSEKLRESLNSAIGVLSEGDENVCSNAENALYFISKAASLDSDLDETVCNVKEAIFNLNNALETISDLRDNLEFSEEEYNEMELRISLINRLYRKYNLDEKGLIEYADECQNRLSELDFSDEMLQKLNKQLKEQYNICIQTANNLSSYRKQLALSLKERVTSELKDLNMPSVRFEVQFTEIPLSKNGIDDIRFLISANAGEELGRISKIASGGELSRIMLALKNVFAENDIVDTMIFDEIDSGVSGVSAQRVAEKLWKVSRNKQVMCISHLPQIASMADNEFLVSKSEINGRTYTEVDLLDFEGRKKEIARMFGGDNITEKTLAAAEEQLYRAKEYKNESRR